MNAWEKRKLKELGDTYSGLSGKTKEDFGHGEARYVTYMNVFTNPVADPVGTETTEIDTRQNEVKKNDVFFTTSSETPGEVGMSSVWPIETKNVYLNSFCFGYRILNQSSLNFLFIAQQMRSPSFRKRIIVLAQGISRYNISKKKVLEIPIFKPSLNEQNKIGHFLSNVDVLIAATQHKIDALEQAKKALLQCLFDQSWRFKGYSDPWEKRKVSDYLCESRIPGSNGLKAKKLTVKLWGKGVVPKNETYSGSIKTKYYVRSANQLIYGKLDFLHAAFGIVPQSLDGWESTIDSPAFDVNTSIGNAAFLLALFLKPNFYLREGIRANGSRKAKRIHEDTFLSMSISAPQRKEQNQIAMVLDKTEFLIAATQSRLSSLELLKKALLQDLFI
ncbi:restriction endonuclease subunit S [Lacticaseibacillus paracasei]|uniref:restriction endonuclease subunit S n=1 Tax=Lacticaseibacillus paracasei TaxID=1597 RepID=UPI0021A48B05|nr:restriction endonuclease subunit S [Lacticaseibacillus paracasei]MCT2892710.1 restriction endonuclease subunit S [Lacticaseibacillus paracasei]